MDWQRYVVSDPNILVGKATIRGTRISVEMILEDLADGLTEDEILKGYPELNPEAIRAAVAYAAAVVKEDSHRPLASTA